MSEAKPMPEGWYEDPSNPGTQRYWDGEAWIPGLSITPEPKKKSGSSGRLGIRHLEFGGFDCWTCRNSPWTSRPGVFEHWSS